MMLDAFWKSIKIQAAAAILLLALIQTAHAATSASTCGGPYALIYVVDGIPTDVFQQMLNEGALPNFREHIYDRGTYSQHNVTVYPPLTFPAMGSIFSGYYPSHHNAPNTFCVDRKEALYKNYLSISLENYQKDIEQNASFLMEYFPCRRTLSFGLPLNIGADHTRGIVGSMVDISRESRDLDYVEKSVRQEHAIGLDMFVKPLKLLSLFNPAKDTNVISLLDPPSSSGVLRYLAGSLSPRERALRRQVPAIVLYYDWEPDRAGHVDGPHSEEMREDLIETDEQFGRLVQAYREAGIYDHTFFFLTSDHGHIWTRPEYVPIDRIFAERGFKTIFISHELIARAPLSILLRMRQIAVGKASVIGYNCAIGTADGDSVGVFLTKGGGTDRDSWAEDVYFRDLFHYPLGPDKYIDIPKFIHSIDGVNFFIVRESEFLPGRPHVTRIVGPYGSSLVSAYLRGSKPVRIRYDVAEGIDPLGYAQNPALATFFAEGYHDDREWLRATVRTHYPDAPVQIAQIMETPLSGSLIIIPDDHRSFNSRVYGKHGGFAAGEILSVFAVSGPGIKHGSIESSRAVDFLPTFLYLMGKDFPSNWFDGIPLVEIIGKANERTGAELEADADGQEAEIKPFVGPSLIDHDDCRRKVRIGPK
jgi:hypothetical protein